ncbi:uncharacterized protein LOC111251478 isoform X3 [Varroa destructor]|uniref:Uncharacterized protein n=1 Tax=Varroa destructor TaxID=109461 RepID=A0A7M7KP26_VARDE|nr:uncharacterized protein LOC111251478 isoform X3 [Varroa destructor]
MDTFPIRRVRGRSFGIYRLERRIFSLRYRLRHRFSGAMQLKCCQGGAQPISMVRFVGVQRHQGKPSTSLVRVTYHTIVHTNLFFGRVRRRERGNLRLTWAVSAIITWSTSKLCPDLCGRSNVYLS